MYYDRFHFIDKDSDTYIGFDAFKMITFDGTQYSPIDDIVCRTNILEKPGFPDGLVDSKKQQDYLTHLKEEYVAYTSFLKNHLVDAEYVNYITELEENIKNLETIDAFHEPYKLLIKMKRTAYSNAEKTFGTSEETYFLDRKLNLLRVRFKPRARNTNVRNALLELLGKDDKKEVIEFFCKHLDMFISISGLTTKKDSPASLEQARLVWKLYENRNNPEESERIRRALLKKIEQAKLTKKPRKEKGKTITTTEKKPKKSVRPNNNNNNNNNNQLRKTKEMNPRQDMNERIYVMAVGHDYEVVNENCEEVTELDENILNKYNFPNTGLEQSDSHLSMNIGVFTHRAYDRNEVLFIYQSKDKHEIPIQNGIDFIALDQCVYELTNDEIRQFFLSDKILNCLSYDIVSEEKYRIVVARRAIEAGEELYMTNDDTVWPIAEKQMPKKLDMDRADKMYVRETDLTLYSESDQEIIKEMNAIPLDLYNNQAFS